MSIINHFVDFFKKQLQTVIQTSFLLNVLPNVLLVALSSFIVCFYAYIVFTFIFILLPVTHSVMSISER